MVGLSNKIVDGGEYNQNVIPWFYIKYTIMNYELSLKDGTTKFNNKISGQILKYSLYLLCLS